MSTVTAEAVRHAVLERVSPRLKERGLQPENVADDFDLLAEGVVDSFGLLELIGAVEAQFGLSIDFEEIDAADLTSIGPFSRFVEAYSQAFSAPATDGHTAQRTVTAPTPPSQRDAGALHRMLGRKWIGVHHFARRARAKAFSILSSGGFASFGAESVIQPPVRLEGVDRIAIGSGVFIGEGSWLQVIGDAPGVCLTLGDGVGIAGNCVFSAVLSIEIGRAVSMGRNVHVADHAHEYRNTALPVLEQGLTDIHAVQIGDGAWIGQSVVVLPGTRIGKGAVIAANSVVGGVVPDFTLAAGAPARPLLRFG